MIPVISQEIPSLAAKYIHIVILKSMLALPPFHLTSANEFAITPPLLLPLLDLIYLTMVISFLDGFTTFPCLNFLLKS